MSRLEQKRHFTSRKVKVWRHYYLSVQKSFNMWLSLDLIILFRRTVEIYSVLTSLRSKLNDFCDIKEIILFSFTSECTQELNSPFSEYKFLTSFTPKNLMYFTFNIQTKFPVIISEYDFYLRILFLFFIPLSENQPPPTL